MTSAKATNIAGAFGLPLVVVAGLTRILAYVVTHVPALKVQALPPVAITLALVPLVIGLGLGVLFALRLVRNRVVLCLLYCPLMLLALWATMAAVAFFTFGGLDV